MDKNKSVLPLITIGVSVLFAFACLMVWLSRGKSEMWIARKLKLGGLALTFTATMAGCSSVTCYDPAPNNVFMFNNAIGGQGVVIKIAEDSVLTGTANSLTFNDFDFVIRQVDGEQIDSGIIQPVDGSFNSSNEDFKMTISKAIPKGKYVIDVLAVKKRGTSQEKRINVWGEQLTVE